MAAFATAQRCMGSAQVRCDTAEAAVNNLGLPACLACRSRLGPVLRSSAFGSATPRQSRFHLPAVKASSQEQFAAAEEVDVEDFAGEEEIEPHFEYEYDEEEADLLDLGDDYVDDEDDDDSEARVDADGFVEEVVQVRRVTKVVKGGKLISFRAVVVVGDKNGQVGVGVDSAPEVVDAVTKAARDAKRHIVKIPLNKAGSFPHKSEAFFGAAKVMLRPACEGTGVIAGGAVRVVLEAAGVRNAFGKQLGSKNPLNNARAALECFKLMRTFQQVAAERGLSVSYLMSNLKPKSPDFASHVKAEAAAAEAGAVAVA